MVSSRFSIRELQIKIEIMKQLQINFQNPDTACTIPCVSVSYLGEEKTCKTCAYWKKIMCKSHPNTEFRMKVFPCYHPYTIKNLTFAESEKTETDSCERWQYER